MGLTTVLLKRLLNILSSQPCLLSAQKFTTSVYVKIIFATVISSHCRKWVLSLNNHTLERLRAHSWLSAGFKQLKCNYCRETVPLVFEYKLKIKLYLFSHLFCNILYMRKAACPCSYVILLLRDTSGGVIELRDNSGGSRHLSLNLLLSCKKPPATSSPCASSPFTGYEEGRRGQASNESGALWWRDACQAGKACRCLLRRRRSWNLYPAQLHTLLSGPPGCPEERGLSLHLKRAPRGPPGMGEDEEKGTVISFLAILIS